jgi:hypothetical protein
MKHFTVWLFSVPLLVLPLAACSGQSHEVAAPAVAPAPPPGFPVLRLDTRGAAPIDDLENYVSAELAVSANGYVDPFGRPCADVASTPVKVRGRGNTTWEYPKKPYRLKFGTAIDLFGMGADRDWVLLADYIDPTGLRNVLAFELGRRLGVPYTHQARHVNLVLNGTSRGLYLLTEHTETGSNRVVIEPRDGYLVEFDDYPSEEIFSTRTLDLPLKIKVPDVAALEGEARAAAIKRVLGVFNTFEATIAAADGPGDYAAQVDVDLLIDWFLVHEITHNHEPQHPKSCFFHRGEDGRIAAGPLWDFDYAYDYELPATDVLFLKDRFWFKHLFKDPAFRARLKARWAAIRAEHVDTLPAYLDAVAVSLRDSVTQDQLLFPTDDEIRLPADSGRLRTWLTQRIEALDAAIAAL